MREEGAGGARSLVLASGSPRRRTILTDAGYRFRVEETNVPEDVPDDVLPAAAAVDLAVRKAMAVKAGPHEWVLGADTVIDLDGRLVGKPVDVADAARILRSLSGASHWVATGVAVLPPRREPRTGLAQTKVTFRDLTPAEIDAYVATGEPMGKAGAYAVQGGGKALIARVDGEVDTVVGLPMSVVRRLLLDAGFHA